MIARPSSRLRRAAAALVLLIAGTLAALAAAEMALRIFRPQALLHDPDAYDPDPILGGRLRPGFRDLVTTSEYATRWEINAGGYRGPLAAEKRAGVSRVVAIGDSFTFGYGVEEAEAWPRRLESLLDAATTAGHYEVVNLGVGGYGTWQEALWLEEQVKRGLAPDLVIAGFYTGNDLSDSVRGERASAGAAPAATSSEVAAPPSAAVAGVSRTENLKRWLASRVHLYALVADRADGLLIRLGLRNVVYPEEVDVLRLGDPPEVREGWEAVGSALQRLRDLSDRAGYRILTLSIPMRHQVSAESWRRVEDFYRRLQGGPLEGVDLDHPRLRLAATCAAHGVPLLDLAETFRRAPDPASLYFRRDQHLTREGHDLAARAVAKWVRDHDGEPEGAGAATAPE